MKFRKPQLVPLLFIAATVAVLASFGAWQVQRLAWKEGLIAQIEAAQAAQALTQLPPSLTGLEYRNVTLTGNFMNGKSLRLVGSLAGVGPGFFVLTPLKLKDNRIILVNRGFAPEGMEGAPAGVQTVNGILRPPRGKRAFVPENQPEKNLWLTEDISTMSKTTGLDLLPLIVEVTGAREQGVYPMPGDGKIKLRNDHLGYAITWFSLAALALIMFAVYHRIPQKEGSGDGR
jgi:surfeit locus 1 family protein